MLQKSGAPTIAFALLKQRTTNTSARARSAEQPRTPGAFANRASVALADSKTLRSANRSAASFGPILSSFDQFFLSKWPLALVRYP